MNSTWIGERALSLTVSEHMNSVHNEATGNDWALTHSKSGVAVKASSVQNDRRTKAIRHGLRV